MTRSLVQLGGQALKLDADRDTNIISSADDAIMFTINGSEAAQINSSGNLFIGTTDTSIIGDDSTDANSNGIHLQGDGQITSSTNDGTVLRLNRMQGKGTLIQLRQAGSIFAEMGIDSGNDLQIYSTASSHSGLQFGNGNITPLTNSGGDADNTHDLGAASIRFDDVFATNGTIQTSDQNEKQDIASATAKELNVAKKLSTLFKTFRWKDKVTEKGDKARTHTGIVAQEVQSAFSAEGLDASNYGLFTSDIWWEKEIKVDAVKADEEKGIEAKDAHTYMDIKYEKTDGYTERTRLGVRYPELFSFIFSSLEARLTAQESK